MMYVSKALNIVLVGDSGVGKSTLIARCHEEQPTLIQGGFFTKPFEQSSNYEHTSLQAHNTNIYSNPAGMVYSVYQTHIIDTGGAGRYDNVRPLAYMHADVFILCFDITNRASFENILLKWFPEVRLYEPKTPVILVGTKGDLQSEWKISESEAVNLGYKINVCHKYFETSSFGQSSKDAGTVFEAAVEHAFKYRHKLILSRRGKKKYFSEEPGFDVTNLETPSRPPHQSERLPTLAKAWKTALEKDIHTDVTLKFSDDSPSMKAHKFVLGTTSEAFRDLFLGIPVENSLNVSVSIGKNHRDTLADTSTGYGVSTGRERREEISLATTTDKESNTGQTFRDDTVAGTCSNCTSSTDNTDSGIGSSTTNGSNSCWEPDAIQVNMELPFTEVRHLFEKEATICSYLSQVEVTLEESITRPVFLYILEWMYTGDLNITGKIEDVKYVGEVALRLKMEPLAWLCRDMLLRETGKSKNKYKAHSMTSHTTSSPVAAPQPPPPPPPPPPILPSAAVIHRIPAPPPPYEISASPPPPLSPSILAIDRIPVPPPLPPLIPSCVISAVLEADSDQTGVSVPPVTANHPIPSAQCLHYFQAFVENYNLHETFLQRFNFPPPRHSISSKTSPEACDPPRIDPVAVHLFIWRYVTKELFLAKPFLSDVTFVVEETLVPAHKIVLITRSPVMAAMLDGGFKEKECGTIDLPGVCLAHFLAVLEYMYTDYYSLDDSNVRGILVMADRFCIQSLVECCERYIVRTFTAAHFHSSRELVDTLMELLFFAKAYNCQYLYKWCLHYTATNYDLFDKQEDYKVIVQDNKEYIEEVKWLPLTHFKVLEEYKRQATTRRLLQSTGKTFKHRGCTIL